MEIQEEKLTDVEVLNSWKMASFLAIAPHIMRQSTDSKINEKILSTHKYIQEIIESATDKICKKYKYFGIYQKNWILYHKWNSNYIQIPNMITNENLHNVQYFYPNAKWDFPIIEKFFNI